MTQLRWSNATEVKYLTIGVGDLSESPLSGMRCQDCSHQGISLEKTLMLGKIEAMRRKGLQRTRWLDGIIDSMDMSLQTLGDSEGQGSRECCSPWGCKELDMTE